MSGVGIKSMLQKISVMPKKNASHAKKGQQQQQEHIMDNSQPPQANHAGLTVDEAPGSPKRVYLIRHGESMGQRASRKMRSQDHALTDCPLSHQGEFQATVIPSLLGSERYSRIDYVVSSPLTRAVQTAVLGFPSKDIVINYDLYEIGGRETNVPIPENRPRPLSEVLAETGGEERIDGATFAPIPTGFPKSHSRLSNKDRKEKVRRVWPKLWQFCDERGFKEIAVVCHFNIIRMALSGDNAIQPKNAVPIECFLHCDGRLVLVDVLENNIEDLSVALTEVKERNKSFMEAGTAELGE